MAEHIDGGVMSLLAKLPWLIPIAGPGVSNDSSWRLSCSVQPFCTACEPQRAHGLAVIGVFAVGVLANSIILPVCSQQSPLWYAALVSLLVCGPWFSLVNMNKAFLYFEERRSRQQTFGYAGEFLIPVDLAMKLSEANGGEFPRPEMEIELQHFANQLGEDGSFLNNDGTRRQWVQHVQGILTHMQQKPELL
jgi:hypothetical protein